jgi:hypothetical protein
MKTRTIGGMMLISILCLFAAIAAAQSKPNFSGTWKMNPQKSKLDRDNGGSKLVNIVVKIDHRDPIFSESMIVSRSDGDQTAEGEYTTDGKDSEVRLPFGAAKATAKWEGDALLVEWRNESEKLHVLWKYALSADGKTLTVSVRDISNPNQKVDDEIVVFERSDPPRAV